MKLQKVEGLIGQGMPRTNAICQISVTEQTYFRWKKGRFWLNPSRDIAAQYPAGQWMDRVSVYVLSIAITSGRMTSCTIARMMAGRSGHSTSWMNIAKNAPSRQHGFAMRLPGNGSIWVKRKLNPIEVIDALTDLFILGGVPAYIRSDNGPEFIAEAVRDWIKAVGAKTAYIEPGSLWENGYCEIFNGRMRDGLLNGEIFSSLQEAPIIIERGRNHYNTKRPHSALGYRPPAPEAIVPMGQRPMIH